MPSIYFMDVSRHGPACNIQYKSWTFSYMSLRFDIARHHMCPSLYVNIKQTDLNKNSTKKKSIQNGKIANVLASICKHKPNSLQRSIIPRMAVVRWCSIWLERISPIGITEHKEQTELQETPVIALRYPLGQKRQAFRMIYVFNNQKHPSMIEISKVYVIKFIDSTQSYWVTGFFSGEWKINSKSTSWRGDNHRLIVLRSIIVVFTVFT